MIIGLYGVYGAYNFGCEAIIRGSVKFVNDVFNDVRIKYYSYSYDYDRRVFFDSELEIIPVEEKRSMTKRLANKALSTLDIDRRYLYINSNVHRLLSDVDMILSIGGDIYTIPAVLREKDKYPYYNSLIDFCNQSKKKIVVYGASVGPWGNYAKAVKYYSDHMKKYCAILCREQSSVRYLQSLHFDNVMFFPDPAFQLGEGKNNNGEYIGINLSPLSLDEVYGNHGEEQLQRLASLIDEIYEKHGRPIMFLPHVLSPNEADNDLWFMEKVKAAMKHGNIISIADSSKGFMGIKDAIRNCHIVISARMHCAINAMEENVPTILLSYSQKSIGMCEYVYGEDKWCISMKELESVLIDRIEEMDQSYDEITRKLKQRNVEIQLEYGMNIEKVKKLIC